MKTSFGICLLLLVVAALAPFSDPISVAHAGKPAATPVTCTLAGSYYIDPTTSPDTLIPFVAPSGDCGPVSCTFTFSSRIGDIGDFFAICTGSTPCDAYTTISVDATVDSFPYTNEPEVIGFCSSNPVGDALCLTGSAGKCGLKEVDCFAGIDPACSASKKLGGGIKNTFTCVLNLPEPPAEAVADTVYVTAHCSLS
jgi:hypothetical protein